MSAVRVCEFLGRSCLSFSVLAIGWLCCARPALSYDPRTNWRTLTTPHHRVHYPQGLYWHALDVARAAERAYGLLRERLAWSVDGPIEIVIDDESDFANGFAQLLPYPVIGVNTVAPEDVSDLGHFDDWNYGLIVHELAHIVHIDTISGLPKAINAIFGRLLTPNGAQPRWITEGLATYFESALTSGGRVRSAYFDMFLRTAVLFDDSHNLGVVTGSTWEWPQGSIPYLYGGRFFDYLSRRFGESSLATLSHDYSRRLVPWAVNLSVKRATGYDYPSLFEDFNSELLQRYEAQRDRVVALGRVEGQPLTRRGQQIGPPRMSRDGTLYFVESAIGEHATLRSLDPSGKTRDVTEVQGGARLSLVGKDRALLSQVEVHDVYRRYNDLFWVELDSGKTTRLTQGARARSPDVSADGQRVVFVQIDAGHSVLRVASLPAMQDLRTLVDLGPMTHVWTPRFSPDGQEVVFAGLVAGQRDIYIVDVWGHQPPRRITSDSAQDGGPTFSPDGSTIVFHSDRDGIFNLYAQSKEGSHLRRVSRVLTGAFHPELSADGRTVVYRSYGLKGFDLARLEIEALDALPAEQETARPQPPPVNRATKELYPSHDYRAWPTILPKAWLPISAEDTRGTTYGLSLAGGDVVGLHSYTLESWWGVDSKKPGASLRYVNRQFHPGITMDLTSRLGFAAIPFVRNGRSFGVEERVHSMRSNLRWPLWTTRDWSLSLHTGYEVLWRGNLRPLVFEPDDRAPVIPDDGRFAFLRLGLSLATAQSFLGSISPEKGGRFNISLRVEDPVLGSEYSSTLGTLSHTHYFENPWIARHVLALRVFGGYGKSSYRRRRLFAAGGLARRDLALDVANSLLGFNAALRGFSLIPFTGDAIVTGSVEYRFPLWDFESGIETLPLFFRTLHAAAFVDGAAVADVPSRLSANQHYSAGIELRMGLLLGYFLPVTVRFGYGHGLGPDKDLEAFYLVLGQPF